MKIKIIDVDTDREIDLENIYLSENNPRHTIISDINVDLKKYILGKKCILGEQTYITNAKKIFRKLLGSEGDFSNLCELLTYINNIGFKSSDFLYLINDSDNFIVAEGNRRLMCLKLMTNLFTFPSWENFNNSFENSYSNESTNQISDLSYYEKTDMEIPSSNESEENKKKINFERCNNLIEEIKHKHSNAEFKVEVKIVENDNDLWKYIYGKHLTGEEPGLRKWSRSKYFADLLSMFPNGLNNKDKGVEEFFLSKFRRRFDLVKEDYKIAQFVYYVIYYQYIENEENIPVNLNNTDILNIMIQLNKVSSLEPNHSYNKIRAFICDEILNIEQKQFRDIYFDYHYEKSNNILKFKFDGKIKINTMLNFIYEKWTTGILTTRPIKKSDYELLKNELTLMIYDINLSKKIDRKKITEINEFDLTISQLDSFICVNEIFYNDDILHRFRLAKEIKSKNNLINKSVEEKKYDTEFKPSDVFDVLIEQYKLIAERFLHARTATIRSIIEQFKIWACTLILHESITSGENNEEITKQFQNCINSLCGEYKDKTKDKLIKKHLNDFLKNDEQIIRFVKKYFDINNIDNEEIKNFLSIIQNDEFYDMLNECVHSFHRVYQNSKYEQYLSMFIKDQDSLINILQYLHSNSFAKIDKLIKDRIANKDKER